jgi:hypothetical protein
MASMLWGASSPSMISQTSSSSASAAVRANMACSYAARVASTSSGVRGGDRQPELGAVLHRQVGALAVRGPEVGGVTEQRDAG